MTAQKGFYITTAIVYPNSRMHVGFGWEVIGSDMRARFERMKGRDVFFCTGVDEHSQNVEKAALKDRDANPGDYAGLADARAVAKKYCDKMADDIVKVMAMMDVAYDRFIRTSDPDHERVCQHLIEKSKSAGDVFLTKHEGLYCDGCEVFYTEKEAMLAPLDEKSMADSQSAAGTKSAANPKSAADAISEANSSHTADVKFTSGTSKYHCPTHKQPLRVLAEENYFFKLSKFEEALKKLFRERPDFLAPEGRKNEVLSFLEGGLKDFSVSRTTFKWGISIPFDPGHIIYVWFDALINYLSAVKFPVRDASGKVVQGDEEFFKRFWPCDVHVIGKDITRFHCLYWPAMLMSAQAALPKGELPLPERVWAHGFIAFQGEKMSKTRGNIVTPDEVIRDFSASAGAPYGATALRWYLLSANPFDADGNYADESLVLKCNADLSNNIGNLVNRTVSMTMKYFPDGLPQNPGVLPPGVKSVSDRAVDILLHPRVGAAGAAGGVALYSELAELMRKMDLSGYCARIVEFSMSMNKFIDETKPWALAKVVAAGGDAGATARANLATALAELLEGIRCLGVALWPAIPGASEAILAQLGITPATTPGDWIEKSLFREGTAGNPPAKIAIPRLDRLEFDSSRRFALVEPKPLFPRLEIKA
ncbi:MAG: methionine--tRNA ligase [Deltaproteobacteria bacterium]|nr:methionine--tRNA ligase [Deltaproteobacteria bacterium]